MTDNNRYPPYEGPTWLYEVHEFGSETPVAFVRDYQLAKKMGNQTGGGVRVGGCKSGYHVNEIDEIEVVIHGQCWAPQMRCVVINHPWFVQHKCNGCDNSYVEKTKKTFKLIGTSRF